VIPALQTTAKRGGVYLGVGPEQNFTYIVALKPRIAFIFDIRRENLLEHLMYKALFEFSSDRVDFLSRLFPRKPSPGLKSLPSTAALFAAFAAATPDAALFTKNLREIKNNLTKT